ncbi:hypothetical protein ME9_01329 [Bartonella taylorii 8TBB]|uniref:Uncharacterized protein n=2 Tax=Bartonella taylorii TaxID=33046 RepID=A0A9P2RY61_BARTA|nr:hypothetical protein ME9_01329 [Bartonella taylorii 8TBB]
MYRYGNTGAIVDAHSRGSLTLGNGMRDFAKHGIHGIGYKTKIDTFGPAFNIQIMANTLDYVSDGKKDHIYLQNHLLDPVGMRIGHNLPTFYKVPLKLPYVLFPPAIPIIEQGRALLGYDPSTHNCYGNAGDACTGRYGTPHTATIYSSDAVSLMVFLRHQMMQRVMQFSWLIIRRIRTIFWCSHIAIRSW